MGDHGVQTGGGGHAGLVDHDEGVGTDLGEPVRSAVDRGVVLIGAVHVLVEGVSGCAQVFAEHDRRGRGGGQPEDLSAGAAPGVRQGGHGGGFARPRRGQREPDAAAAEGHLGHQSGLAVVEGFAARGGVREGQTHVCRGRDTAIELVRCGQDSPLGGEDVSAGVGRGAVAAVDAGTVAATQRDRLTQLGVVDAGMGHRERLR